MQVVGVGGHSGCNRNAPQVNVNQERKMVSAHEGEATVPLEITLYVRYMSAALIQYIGQMRPRRASATRC